MNKLENKDICVFCLPVFPKPRNIKIHLQDPYNTYLTVSGCWVIFHVFCCLLIFFKVLFFKRFFLGIPSVSNSLDPDQAQHYVKPDLSSNCLQRLSADNTNKVKQRVKSRHGFRIGEFSSDHFCAYTLLKPM